MDAIFGRYAPSKCASYALRSEVAPLPLRNLRMPELTGDPVDRLLRSPLRYLRTSRSRGRICPDNQIALRSIHYQGKFACQLGH